MLGYDVEFNCWLFVSFLRWLFGCLFAAFVYVGWMLFYVALFVCIRLCFALLWVWVCWLLVCLLNACLFYLVVCVDSLWLF